VEKKSGNSTNKRTTGEGKNNATQIIKKGRCNASIAYVCVVPSKVPGAIFSSFSSSTYIENNKTIIT